MDPVNTNYDFGFNPDADADETTTDVIDVPQENLPPKAFDEEVESKMVDYVTTEEPLVLATPQHQPPSETRVIDMQLSTLTRTKIARNVK